MARGSGGQGLRAQQGATRGAWRPQPLGENYEGEVDSKTATVVYPDVCTEDDTSDVLEYIKNGDCDEDEGGVMFLARVDVIAHFLASREDYDDEAFIQAKINLLLGQELVLSLRHFWLIQARRHRPRLAPSPSFVGAEGEDHATTYTRIVQRFETGAKKGFGESNERIVTKEVNARYSGCLCWGSLAEVVDPRAYSQFEKAYFEPMKPFGSMVELSEVFVELVDSIYTSARTQTEDEILRNFGDEHEYEVYGLTGLEQPLSFRVLPPFEYQGKKYRGAVWIGAFRSCFGKYVDPVGEMTDQEIAEVRDSAPLPPSQVFYKIKDFMERSGASVPNSCFNAVCYESALFAHLRIHAPEIIKVIHFAGDDVATKTVPAMICFNESGQTEVIGHWAFITKRPGSTDEPMIISTNDHFLSRDMRLFGEKIGDLVAGEAQGDFNRHVGAVLRNFVTRVDASAHRQDATGEHENVFIGSKWTDAEREGQLPRMAIRAAALVSVLASANGDNNCWHRKLEKIELIEHVRDVQKRYENYVQRFRDGMGSRKLLERWAPKMFTRAGVVERLLENDRRIIAYAERQDSDPLTMWPLCYFIFFASPYNPHLEPTSKRHMVDLQESEADEANMALM